MNLLRHLFEEYSLFYKDVKRKLEKELKQSPKGSKRRKLERALKQVKDNLYVLGVGKKIWKSLTH